MKVRFSKAFLFVALLALASVVSAVPAAAPATTPCATAGAATFDALFLSPPAMTAVLPLETASNPFEPLQAGCLQVCRECAANGEYCCAASPGNCVCC